MADDDEHWFLPGPPIDEAPTDPPWRLAERQAIFDPKAWRRARRAAAFARLDARATKGFAKRLAFSEASALLWAQGDWVPPDKIALYGLLRESALKDARGCCQRRIGLSAPNDAQEAGVAAGKIGGVEGRHLRFLPVATGGAIGLGGSLADRLARWYSVVENACLKAEMELDKLALWQEKAETATKGLSGKTPPLLIKVLLETPALTASMVAAATGADKATARRNLNVSAELGLIREITGQGRYKVWAVLN